MITDDKIKELQKMLSKGVPDGEIKENMRKEGYAKEDIDKVFAPHKYDMRSWYMIFGVIFLIAGFCVLAANGSVLLLVFSGLLSGLLFLSYYRETERLKK